MKFAAVVTMFVLLVPLRAHACSCVPPGTVEQEMNESASVFLGRVTSIQDRTPEMDTSWIDDIVAWFSGLFGGPALPTDRDFPYKRVTFSVSETFRGSPASKLQLTTGMGGGDCGYLFKESQEYVVYARGEPSALTASICSLTGPASDPRSGLEVLRDAR